MVFAVYLLSFVLAVALLVTIYSRPWYLHVLAVGAALALGFLAEAAGMELHTLRYGLWRGHRFPPELGDRWAPDA